MKKLFVLLIAFLVSFSILSVSIFYPSAVEISPRILEGTFEYNYIHTTGGLTVSAWNIYEELTDSRIAEIRADVALNYPNVVELGAPTSNYNCHAYAWLNRARPDGLYIPNPDAFLEDPNTICVDESDLQSGDIVTYRVPSEEFIVTHSAVVEEIVDVEGEQVIMCSSKWGEKGLYYHALEDCPYYLRDANGAPIRIIEYYRYEHSAHTIDEDFYSASGHGFACNDCEWEYLVPHTLIYTSDGSTQHTASCTSCAYTRSATHIWTYRDKNGIYHDSICSICNYTKSEKHVLDLSGKRCLRCGRTGTFAVNKKNPDEFTE